jgi:nondiscriminating aspartyl-tRNA synthetase
MKAVAETVGEKCEFEDPAVIQERFGLQVGGVPPFGNLLNIDNYYDESILQRETAAFNCGLATESIILKSKDLFALVEPKLGKFAKT